jgi:ATP-dependent helicase/nuclease subunit B
MNTQMLIKYLSEGATIVTATERLSRELRIRYGIHQKEGGLSSWESPAVMSLRAYVEGLWLEDWPTEQVVEPIQEASCYRRVIARSPSGAALIMSQSMSRVCQQAASLMARYELSSSREDNEGHEEFTAFLGWRAEVENEKQRNSWVTREDITQKVTDLLKSGAAVVTGKVVFVGFLDMTPQDRAFVAAVDSAGATAVIHDVEHGGYSDVTFQRHATPVAEIEYIAGQLKGLLDSYIGNETEAPHIAVVVPDVDKWRPLIDRAFSKTLSPHTLLPEHAGGAIPWRYSKGTPLSDHELINSALQVIRITSQRLVLDEATTLLLNPRIGDYRSEGGGRARIDLMIRKWGARKLPLKSLIQLAEGDPGRGMAPDLGQRLASLSERIRTQGGVAYPSVWVERFSVRLNIMGWPGESTLSSDAYQAKEAWDEKLVMFAGMDKMVGEVNAFEAVSLLQELVTAHPFLARPSYRAPIEVVGLWDVAGYQYDYAYVLSVSAGELPARARPNPLLPYELQKKAEIPTCCPETELYRGKVLAEQLLRLAKTAVISCPMTTREGFHITPSLLLNGWPSEPSQCDEETESRNSPDLEVLEERFPPVSESEIGLVRGGVSILSAYARAPFFAAAEARLHLQEFPVPTEGVDARLQGDIVHGAMEYIWGELKDSDGLAAVDDEELYALIIKALEVALSNPEVVPPYALGKCIRELERARSAKVISRWFRFERSRVERFEVICRESRVSGVVGGLPVKLRVDRIDRVHTENGVKHLVWDYKTGASVNTGVWMADVLTEPQLPIYATLDLSELKIDVIDGIGFAQLTDAESTPHIMTNWAVTLDGSPGRKGSEPVANWVGQLNEWRAQLEGNAAGFLSGRAEIDYSSYGNHKFTHGHLFGLLRVAEQEQGAECQ